MEGRNLGRATAGEFSFTFKAFEESTAENLTSSSHQLKPSPAQSPTVKRGRSRTDVDGEGFGYIQKKKRRIRRHLITSKLSRPYAIPPTYIVDRGKSRIAIWARQKGLAKQFLRKAAIMNNIRMKHNTVTKHDRKPKQQVAPAFRNDSFLDDEIDLNITLENPDQYWKGPIDKALPIQSLQSPLGLSNYDAFDREGDPYEDEDLESTSHYSWKVHLNQSNAMDKMIDSYPTDTCPFDMWEG